MNSRVMKAMVFLAIATVLGSTMVSCATAPAVVEKSVVQTVVVEKEVVVEKPVVQTVVVEKHATRGGTVIVAMNLEPDTLDPHVTSSKYSRQVVHTVYETLVNYDEEGRKFEPGLASSWEVSDDGLAWTFHLREGVKFHDGTPLNAEAIKINFERMLDPATESTGSIYKVGPLDTIEIVDDLTVKLHFTKPYGAALPNYVEPDMSIVSPAAIEEYGRELYNHMVGTGPFRFVEWEQRDHITLEKYDDYDWARPSATHDGPAYLEQVIWKFVPEDATRTATLMTGEADIIQQVPSDDFARIAANPKFQTAFSAQPGLTPSVMLNVTKPPTDDVRVRKALAYLFDTDAIVRGAYGSMHEVSYNLLSPLTSGYIPEASVFEFDPEKGVALLEEAGWTDSDGDGWRDKDGEKMHLVYPILPHHKDKAVIAASVLAEYGIEVEVFAVDNPAQQIFGQEGKHNMFFLRSTRADVASIMNVLFACENVGAGWNMSHYCVDEAQAMIEAGDGEADPEKRQEIYAELQMKLAEDVVAIPMAIDGLLWAFDGDIMNFRTTIGQYLEFYDLYRLIE